MDVAFLRNDIGLEAGDSLKILNLSNALTHHKVFQQVDDVETLRVFMGAHVFAVWDFMSLLKRLQRDLTCTDVPWIPNADPIAARLINEIVLQEETDVGPAGQGYASHFDIYVAAMAEVGADRGGIHGLVETLKQKRGFIPPRTFGAIGQLASEFVVHTLETANNGTTIQVLASFVLGREEVIPSMFQALLDAQPQLREMAPTLTYYLERHISVDAGEHGPAAWQIVKRTVGLSHAARREFAAAAIAALTARLQLWDRVSQRLTGLSQPLLQSA